MLTRLKSIRPARSITTDDVVYSARSARGNVLQWSTHAWENAGPWLRLAWQDVKADGKKTKWLRGLAWFFLMCLFGGALTVLSISPTLDNAFGDSNACLPDGTFSIEGHYNVWKPSNIFEVTLRSPSQYTFGEVKLIDTVWDVVVGRGGQAVLAYITYIVVQRFLTFQMTQAPIAIPVYKRMFMEPELGLRSTFCLLWDFIKYRPLHSKLGMIWIILTSIFIILFPTFTSAMTSYTPSISPFVKNTEGGLTPYDTVAEVIYVIHDADRLVGLNLGSEYGVRQTTESGSNLDRLIDTCDLLETPESERLCNVINATSEYVSTHGFKGLTKTNSTFMGVALESPTLNIDGFYFDSSYASYGYNWTLPGTNEYPYRTEDGNRTYQVGTELMQRAPLSANGRCQPNNDTFQWGFSFLLLFILVLLLVVWALSTYLIWLQSHFALRYLECENEVAGEYMAAFRLVTAMREEFKTVGQYPDHLSEAELKHTLRYTLGGGCIEQSTVRKEKTVREMRIAAMDARLEEHKWWILAFSILTGCSIPMITKAGAAGLFFGFIGCGAAFAILTTGLMGWSVRSRQLVTIFCTFIGFIVGIVLVTLIY